VTSDLEKMVGYGTYDRTIDTLVQAVSDKPYIAAPSSPRRTSTLAPTLCGVWSLVRFPSERSSRPMWKSWQAGLHWQRQRLWTTVLSPSD
ncbi:MAG: hypothetical protein ABJ360_21790, partial [Roseobacter sp.]